MRRLRVLAWFAPFLLVAALAVSGAHVHKGVSDDTGCVACTLAHAPAAPAEATPVVRTPERTSEVRAESPRIAPDVPLRSIPSPRAPPLG